MKVVMAEPGQYARAAEIGDGLESLQKAVGGLIDWARAYCPGSAITTFIFNASPSQTV